MTDLDPLESPQGRQHAGADLVSRAGRERPPTAESEFHGDIEGPTGREVTTEAVGDPERASTGSGAASGAGGGMLAGAAIAGPVGLAVGAAAGAAVGAAAEAADDDAPTNDDQPLSEPGSQGAAGPFDPANDYMGEERR